VDYLFVGVNANPTELYTFALPNPLEIAQGAAPTALATNTTDVAGGTSGIIVDNIPQTRRRRASTSAPWRRRPPFAEPLPRIAQ